MRIQIFMKNGGYDYEGKIFETIVLVLINSNYF